MSRVYATIPGLGGVESFAEFSRDRVYRYTLERIWDRSISPLMVIGMNPSTADEERDDPTIRRCIRFARDWGYGGLLMGNLFAYRSTDPGGLPSLQGRPAVSPVGELGPWRDGDRECVNDYWLQEMAEQSGLIMAAWGAIRSPYGWESRAAEVRRLLGPRLHVLGLTKDGSPRHPLYVAADTRPVPWGTV